MTCWLTLKEKYYEDFFCFCLIFLLIFWASFVVLNCSFILIWCEDEEWKMDSVSFALYSKLHLLIWYLWQTIHKEYLSLWSVLPSFVILSSQAFVLTHVAVAQRGVRVGIRRAGAGFTAENCLLCLESVLFKLATRCTCHLWQYVCIGQNAGYWISVFESFYLHKILRWMKEHPVADDEFCVPWKLNGVPVLRECIATWDCLYRDVLLVSPQAMTPVSKPLVVCGSRIVCGFADV